MNITLFLMHIGTMDHFRLLIQQIDCWSNDFIGFLFYWISQNTFKEISNFATSKDWIRGRIHLCDVAKKYKSKFDLSFDKEESSDYDEKPIMDPNTDNKSCYCCCVVENDFQQTRMISNKTKMKKTRAFDQRDRIIKGFRSKRSIIIGAESMITRCGFDQNHISAIAAVDYAMRETKPTCALVLEF